MRFQKMQRKPFLSNKQQAFNLSSQLGSNSKLTQVELINLPNLPNLFLAPSTTPREAPRPKLGTTYIPYFHSSAVTGRMQEGEALILPLHLIQFPI